jgi:hypothetical protein
MTLSGKKKERDINDLQRFLVKLDMDGGVIGHTLNTMECIEVLMHGDLENSSSSLSMKIIVISHSNHDTYGNLPARDNAICKEE